MRLVAQTLVNKAIGGDVTAIWEIADQLDGKPSQAVALFGNEEGTEPLTVVIKQMVDVSDGPIYDSKDLKPRMIPAQ